MAQKTVVIKKYENRRLYDTTNSRYVNLEEVAQLLQQGNEVQVIDAGSGEDITRLILTQIIVEDAKAPQSSFPLDLLRQMVIVSGRLSQESALTYMKGMLDLYQNTCRVMAPQLNPFDFLQNLRSAEEGKKGQQSSNAPESSKAGDKNGRSSDPEEVKELKRRLAELEKLVASRATKKRQK